MFVGHSAVALAVKTRVPRVSLGVLLAAAFWLDLLWPILLLLGVERVRVDPGNTAFAPLAFDSYPWSHSLLLAAAWSAAGTLFWRARGGTPGEAAAIGLLVLSHWVLDFVTHRPDLQLWPWSAARVGLGLWNSRAATFAVEGTMYAAGIWLYLRATWPIDRIGTVALWSLLLLCLVLWIAGGVGSPPPSARAVALGSLSAWLIPVWGGWADRHRELVAE
jgi:hypothetical protein